MLESDKTVLSNLNAIFFYSNLLYGVFTLMQRVSNADFITTPKLDIGIILVLNI